MVYNTVNDNKGVNIIIQKIKLLLTTYKRPIRFITVGVMNTLVDFLLFFICYQAIGIYYTISQVIGYSGGVINSFIWNKLWTFESKNNKGQTALEFLRFMVINGISLSVSVIGIKWLVETASWNVLLAKVLVTLIAQLINYTGYKLWVFKK